ncbi:General stress protein 39 [Anatilimnocola aggregata]|uniref:General stress protein 39 n=1 Tax=Anatilimnocola aggregata TaxID=2528021 RepID=A0A517YCF5_9BACT|nr:SDR family NAD(P)-dependent oxidoreductase [Anatilimnocola aggregata]QDU27923.1 General stress protein 39 [Anatilimnocola aggregata]
MDLTGKTALVTGGTLGIGAAIAMELAKRGANLSICARNLGEDAAKVKAEIEQLGRKCLLIKADMAVASECARVVAETASHFGRLDVLVHNAGGPAFGKTEEVTPELWEHTIALHVSANFYLTKAAIPHLKQGGEGAILMISSSAGVRGVPGAIAYATAKGALPQMARSLARDLADDNIRVNVVAPGVIRTRFHKDMSAERKEFNLKNRIPLHREGTAEQVADVAAFLISNDYITGETVVIDGGLSSRIA